MSAGVCLCAHARVCGHTAVPVAPAPLPLRPALAATLARDPAVLRSDRVALRPAATQGQAPSVQAPARLLHVCDLWFDSAPAHQQGCEVRCAPPPSPEMRFHMRFTSLPASLPLSGTAPPLPPSNPRQPYRLQQLLLTRSAASPSPQMAELSTSASGEELGGETRRLRSETAEWPELEVC